MLPHRMSVVVSFQQLILDSQYIKSNYLIQPVVSSGNMCQMLSRADRCGIRTAGVLLISELFQRCGLVVVGVRSVMVMLLKLKEDGLH